MGPSNHPPEVPLNATVATFLSALVLSLGLTPLFRKIALRTQFMDTPQGQLKKHTAPVPYLGGLAIYFSFLLTLQGVLNLAPPPDAAKLSALLIGGTVVCLLGLVDDLFSLSPGTKFLVQAAAAALLIAFGVQLSFTAVTWAAWGLTALWVVGVTNALNLVDIMDGLAGGLAAVAALGFLFVSLSGEHAYVDVAAAALAGSVLGFLPYNVQPARIYMGDSGALFLGFILAGIAMGQSYTEIHPVSLYAPILILGIPIYDTLLVMALRTLKGRSMFQGSNDHLALRLRALGWNVKPIVMTLWTAGALLSAAAFFLVRMSFKRALVFTMALFAVTVAVTFLIAQVRVDGTPSRGFADRLPGTRRRRRAR
jgi:UDP-GlcNAc:undecaprenyl-phosphate GlcNAc-1-phosphate transferase